MSTITNSVYDLFLENCTAIYVHGDRIWQYTTVVNESGCTTWAVALYSTSSMNTDVPFSIRLLSSSMVALRKILGSGSIFYDHKSQDDHVFFDAHVLAVVIPPRTRSKAIVLVSSVSPMARHQ